MGTEIIEYGRKSTDIEVLKRRLDLAEMMSAGMGNQDMLNKYIQETERSESQYYIDKKEVLKMWTEEMNEMVTNKNSTFASFIQTIKKSIELAQRTNQVTAMQSGIVLLSKFLDNYTTTLKEIEDKENIIEYRIITENDVEDEE